MDIKRIGLSILSLLSAFIVFFLINTGQAQKQEATYNPVIPKTWDEQALADLEVPLADASRSPTHMPAADYYRIPVRPIYKSYPKYHPDREPRVTLPLHARPRSAVHCGSLIAACGQFVNLP